MFLSHFSSFLSHDLPAVSSKTVRQAEWLCLHDSNDLLTEEFCRCMILIKYNVLQALL